MSTNHVKLCQFHYDLSDISLKYPVFFINIDITMEGI